MRKVAKVLPRPYAVSMHAAVKRMLCQSVLTVPYMNHAPVLPLLYDMQLLPRSLGCAIRPALFRGMKSMNLRHLKELSGAAGA